MNRFERQARKKGRRKAAGGEIQRIGLRKRRCRKKQKHYRRKHHAKEKDRAVGELAKERGFEFKEDIFPVNSQIHGLKVAELGGKGRTVRGFEKNQ